MKPINYELINVGIFIGGAIGWILTSLLMMILTDKKKTIKLLKEHVNELARRDQDRIEKDKYRDKVLMVIAEIFSNEKMSQENRHKLEGLYKLLDEYKQMVKENERELKSYR
jgi:hypothetical protein